MVAGEDRSARYQPMLDPVTGGLAYLLHQAIQGSMGVICLLVVIECALAAAWLATMRYSAKVRQGLPTRVRLAAGHPRA